MGIMETPAPAAADAARRPWFAALAEGAELGALTAALSTMRRVRRRLEEIGTRDEDA